MSKAEENKFYSSKGYRIFPLYYNLFYSCLTITNRDNLSDYLIQKYYGFANAPRFINENKGKLLEVMIHDLAKVTDSAIKMKEVLDHPRIVHLIEYYRYKRIDIDKPRKSIVIRVSDETDSLIKELGKDTKTIGEVVEIAIAYHIANASTGYYDLITFTIQNQSEWQF